MDLTLENITIKSAYGTILNSISLQVAKGTICGIIGTSGAGKSVLLHSMIQGLPQNLTVSGQFNCLDCILIPQDVNEIFNPTKKILSQLPKKSIIKMPTLLQELQLDFSVNSLKKYPSSFSQGELQRISILLALLQDKKVLLLDEPTAFLDYRNKIRLQQCLQQLQQQGYTLVIATHDLDWLTSLSNNIYQLQDGKISKYKYICSTINSKGNPLYNFHEVAPYLNTKIPMNHLLSITQGQVFYKKKIILKNCNFWLKQGDVLAITGGSGVGKTSLGKALCRQDDYKLQGNNSANYSMYYVSQNYSASLTPHLTLKDNLLIAYKKHKGITWYIQYKQMLILCHKLNLASRLLKKYPTELSLGEKQRFILIRSLLFYLNSTKQQSQLLVLDEITSSLNSLNQNSVLQLLQEFLTKHKLTCIVITHNTAILDKLANKCLHIIDNSNSKFYTKKI
ncbi:putative ABC transporter ATP-binding protein YejF [Candidatus Hepatincola sp. Pdp]